MMLRMMLKMCQLEEKSSSFARCLKKCALAMGMRISHLNCLISYTSTEQSVERQAYVCPFIASCDLPRGGYLPGLTFSLSL